MTRAILGCIIWLALSSLANAFGFGGVGGIATNCSQLIGTNGGVDGCAGAPAYFAAAPGVSYLDSRLFADGTVFQSGQASSGVASVLWNVPGRDFAVGITPGSYCNGSTLPCSTTPGTGGALIDASQYAWASRAQTDGICNGGASIQAGPFSDGTMEVRCKIEDACGSSSCSSTPVANIQGFDFTPNGKCIILFVAETGTNSGNGTIVFKNNRYVQPSGGTACNSTRYPPYTSTGVLATYQFNFSPNAAHTWNVDLEDNWLDQNVVNVHSDGGQGIVGISIAGGATIRYNYFGSSPSRTVTAYFCTYMDFSYNASPTSGYWPNDAHGEVLFAAVNGANCPLNSGTIDVDHLYYNNNLVVIPYNPSGMQFTAPVWLNIGNGYPVTVTTMEAELNVGVTNYMRPGGTSYVMQTISTSGSFSYEATGVSGTYNTGDIVAIQNGGSVEPTIRLYGVSGSGTSTTLSLDAWTGGTSASLPSESTYFNTSCTDPGASCSGTGSGLMIKTANYGNYQSGNGVIGFGTSTNMGQEKFTNMSVMYNALDPLGVLGQNAFAINVASGSTLCATNLTTTGNFNLETGNAISFPSGVGSC